MENTPMKYKLKIFLTIFTLTILAITACIPPSGPTENSRPYKTVKGDPVNGRIYTLENGLTVFLTVNRDEPRIQTVIAVRAGHKHDPADATGLAHYLEHMLFKGTDQYGSADWQKEEIELEKIIALYDEHYVTTDSLERVQIYHEIDSISGLAAQLAIPNEYTKMVTAMGAKGTNAYTWVEQTVYINDIPANQINNWLKLEAERFRNPVMRLFHTELETVYEEKNRSLDRDNSKVDELMGRELFKKHPYGTQTTLGSVEHLKNPSLTKVLNYYHKNYVPNNMAISLSGDFDPDTVIELINETLGKWETKPVAEFIPPVEDPITSPIVHEVFGPDAESVTIGFRLGGSDSEDADLLILTEGIISNGTAGLIDLNLNQEQKVLGAWAYPQIFRDYSVYTLAGRPREGQSLEEVKDLLLSQIELVKNGEFPDWLLDAVRNEIKLKELNGYESNWNRAHSFIESFVSWIPWEKTVNKHERYAKINKQDIIDFARRAFKENYVAVYKKIGDDDNVQKVVKPEITPLDIERDNISPFADSIMSADVMEVAPIFLDYDKDIQKSKLNDDVRILHVENEENDLFRLYYVFQMGSDNDATIGLALDYLEYLGTGDLSPAEVQEEFYKVGCSYSVSNSNDQIWVRLAGLQENLEKGMILFEKLLADAKPNEMALENLKKDILKIREDRKLSKRTILWSGLFNYGKYGRNSSFTNILSSEELNELKPEVLISQINHLNEFEHSVMYYGPAKLSKIESMLRLYHNIPAQMKPLPEPRVFPELDMKKNRIYVVNHDMKQAEVILLSKGETYNAEMSPERTLFNNYYGGSMASIVFQTIREAKALAYSVFASYSSPDKLKDSHYVMAYVGTQVDKLPEAMDAMFELLNELPESQISFESSQDAVRKKLETDRVTKASILFNFISAEKHGLDYDIRKDVYAKINDLSMDDVKKFHNEYVKDKIYHIMVIGDIEEMNMASLAKYGEVQILPLEEIFGY
jgi:predicted Zn-dependent peptidase